MAEYLFVRWSVDPDRPDVANVADAEAAAEVEWTVLDSNGRLLSVPTRGPLARAREAAEHRRVVLLAPGLDVISTQAMLPAASHARLRKMLPYSLEETLAEDVENLVFAAGPRLSSGAVSVAVVAKRALERWLHALEAAGITPHAIYSDAEGVPDTPRTLALIIEGDRIYGRRPDHPPFVLEGLGVTQVIDLLRATPERATDRPVDQEGAPPELRDADLNHLLVYADPAAQERHGSELDELRARLASCDVKFMAHGALPRLAATLVHRPGTNLLQGIYAPKSNWATLLRPWRLAAGLAAAAVLLALLTQVVDYFVLRAQDRQLTELIATSCQRVAGSAQIAACEAEVQRRLGDAGALGLGETFLSTLAAIAEWRDPQSRIGALSYRNRVMDLQLVAPGVPALSEFATRLDQMEQFDVQIESTNPTDAGVEGRVQIVGTQP